MLQQNNRVKRLMDICMDKILDNYDSLSNEIHGNYLEDEIYFTKHKRSMQSTLDYLDLVNKNINNVNKGNRKNDDKTIYSIKYLRAEDFFSYDHLLVRYTSRGFTGFIFIQM